MTALRYGSRIVIPMEQLYSIPASSANGYIESIKNRLRQEVGATFFREIESLGGQGMIKTEFRERRSTEEFEHHIFEFSILYSPAQFVMDYHVPFDFLPNYTPYKLSKPTLDKIPIEWQCGHCGQVNLVEEHLECRKCGAPRRVMR